jgi:hypothetical protein
MKQPQPRPMVPAIALAVILLLTSLVPAFAAPPRQLAVEAPACTAPATGMALFTSFWHFLTRPFEGLFAADSTTGTNDTTPPPVDPEASGGSGAGVGADPDGVR